MPIAWAAFLTLLIAGPWLGAGYIFGTDWPGPRRFDFPHDLSSSALLQVLLATAARFLSGEATAKLFIFGLLFVAVSTVYRAVPTGGFAPRAVGSVVYVFNPFVYGRLQYGQLFLLAGYAVLPWVALRLRNLLVKPGVATALIAALSFAILGILSIHLFLVAGGLGAVLVLTYTIAAKDKAAYLKRLVPALLLTVATTLGASAYWVIPVLIGRGPEGTLIGGIGGGDLTAYAAIPDQHLGLLPNLLGLYGFWAEGTGRFASMKDFVPLWPAVLLLLLVVGAIGAIAGFRQTRDRITPWVAGLLVAAAIALILEAGTSQPMTSVLVKWLDGVPIYRGMRDAGKWAALLALVYSQLIGLGAAAILGWLGQGRTAAVTRDWLQPIATGLLLAFPLYYGNGLLFGTHGEIKPSQYPPGWYAADQVLAADHHARRALFLPWHEYMGLSFVQNQNHVVASPAPTFFSVPVLVSADPQVPGVLPPESPDQVAISSLVRDGGQASWAEVLAGRGIKYVLVAHELDWNSYSYLDQQPGLVRVGDFGSIVLYRDALMN